MDLRADVSHLDFCIAIFGSASKVRLRYLKHIDRFGPSHIHGFITGGNVKFLLLTDPTASIHNPASASQTSTPYNPAQRSSAATARSSSYAGSPAASYNPSAPSTEEAVKNFMIEVYDNFVKTMMNPFYDQDAPVLSPVFKARVAAAGKKYL